MIVQFVVKKDGPNKGRFFWTCAKKNGKQCNFFLWGDAGASSATAAATVATTAPASALTGAKRKFSSYSPSDSVPKLDLADTIFAYTDGSCYGNANVATTVNPAGWGFVAVKPKTEMIETLAEARIPSYQVFAEQLADAENCEELFSMFGPVIISATDNSMFAHFHLGANLGSNNTGELSAIAESLIWIRQLAFDRTIPTLKRAVICYDSEYAAKSISGEYNGKKNRELIVHSRRLLDEANRALRAIGGEGIIFAHVKAHRGHYWNERADSLANDGMRGGFAPVGRYLALSAAAVPAAVAHPVLPLITPSFLGITDKKEGGDVL